MREHGKEAILSLIALPKLAHHPVALLLGQPDVLRDGCLDAHIEEVEEPLTGIREFLLAERLHFCLEVFDYIQEHLSEEGEFIQHLGDSVPEAPSLAPVLRAFLLNF